MKIVHVVPGVTAESGGLAAAGLGLAVGLARAGHEVHVVTPGVEGLPVVSGPVQLWRVPVSRGLGRFLLAPALSAVLRRVTAGAEVLHVHGLWTFVNLAAYQAAARAGVPLCVAPHGMLAPWALARRRWRKRLYGAAVERPRLNAAKGVHVLTPAEAADVRAFGVRSPVWEVPNGIDLPGGSIPAAAGTRAGEAPRILYVGRFDRAKGLLGLVDAVGRVHQRGLRARLILAGPDTGGMGDGIRRRAQHNGVGANVCLMGPVVGAAKWELLRGADLFVLPSLHESFSVALLEAMAVGCAVVTTEGVIAPSVREAGAGLTVPGDASSLAEAIEELLRAPAWRRACGRRGARYARSRYSWDRAARLLASAYAEGDAPLARRDVPVAPADLAPKDVPGLA